MKQKQHDFSGYFDKKGKPINKGDIVVFYFCADKGYGRSKRGYTEMIDVCFYNEKKKRYMLCCDMGMASFIERHNEHCKVIGNIYDNPELLGGFWQEELLRKLFPQNG